MKMNKLSTVSLAADLLIQRPKCAYIKKSNATISASKQLTLSLWLDVVSNWSHLRLCSQRQQCSTNTRNY